ncbi:SDR family oxidoreductase [Paenarthrobacter sp. DKR-5]|uniref:SDR family oxidoreductase n=1 Tax=Paenarthrobacter sp. DKR-5 TaxID=2835535 RepID=UPI001BDBB3B0|nr:SDR family oxidoreductase [Paenarthrobacter sp. DKR-5]MBT1002235.1 SDR family oxidoreductase [Paenarthrobacter sp. DKR-5]
MTVLIAGCGDLGTEAGLRFAAAGHRVVGWRRSPGKLPPQLEGVAADLTAELPPVPADTDIVVVSPAAGERSEEVYQATYVDGLRNVLDALERDGVQPRRVLFVSSTAVYGEADGGWVDEQSPAEPASPTGRIIRRAEDLLHERVPGSTVLRLAGIYGPGRTRLIDQVRNGTAELPAAPQFTNRIHRDDAAAAIVHLATAVQEPAPVCIGVDSEPADLRDVLLFLAGELGLPEPPTADRESARGGAKRCANALLLSTGFSFEFPTYREGYRAILAGRGERHP